jgi:hypothetical protein
MTQQYALTGSAAELYERNMVPAIFEPFAKDLVDHADLKWGQRALDIACGTGIVVRLAWPTLASSERVVGDEDDFGLALPMRAWTITAVK